LLHGRGKIASSARTGVGEGGRADKKGGGGGLGTRTCGRVQIIHKEGIEKSKHGDTLQTKGSPLFSENSGQ